MKPIKIKVTPHHRPEQKANGRQTVVTLLEDRLEYKAKFNFTEVLETEDIITDDNQGVQITVDEEGYVLKSKIQGLFKNIQNEISGTDVTLSHHVCIAYTGGAIELSCDSAEKKDELFKVIKEWHVGKDEELNNKENDKS